MAGLKIIKTKIRSIEKTQKVTKAMEAVSAAKMRKSQQRAFAGRAYARAGVAILARVAGSRELQRHPLTRGFDKLFAESASHAHVQHALYVVITSDKGLAGALNSAVLRATLADISSSGLSREQVSIIAVGRKANDFFVNRGFSIEAYHQNTDEITSDLINELVNEAADRFMMRRVDVVKIVYQHFISTFEQRPTLRTVFPLSLQELGTVVHDIVPARGAFSHVAVEPELPPRTYYLEPNKAQVLDAILPRLAAVFVYHALLESQASEHSARMVSMKSASDKAGELRGSLTLQFNKARQAAITREVSEITGGMEAMAA